MTADQVRACLALRWPDSEYLSIAEAPEDSSRSGRKIDLLVISLWQSRGLQRDAVEIKVSMGDWRRELKRAEKADFWWRHSHRFWLAAPIELAMKIQEEIPSGWGLLGCEFDKAPKTVVKPELHEAADLSWYSLVGVLRAASGCSLTALHRAEQRGRSQGFEEGKVHAERRSADGELKRLREQVQAFEAHSGLKISDYWGDAGELGRLVAIVKQEKLEPQWLVDGLGRAAENAVQQAERLAEQAREIQAAAKRVSEALADEPKLQRSA